MPGTAPGGRHGALTATSVVRAPTRRQLGLITAVLAVAALASVLVAYRPSLAPPGLHPREVEFSVAKAQVLVDTRSSQLLDRSQDVYIPLTPQVAVTQALFLKTDAALRLVATAAGIPGQEVSASGPFTLLLGRTNIASSVPPLSTGPRVNKNYRLLVDVDGNTPLISLYGQAPTERAAVAIVTSARTFLADAIAAQETRYPLPKSFGVVIRSLGPVTAGVVDSGAQAQLMALIFAAVALIGGVAVLAGERRRRRRGGMEPVAELDRLADGRGADDDWPHTKRLLPWSMALFMAMLFLVPIDEMTLPIHLPVSSNPDRVVLILIGGLWICASVLMRGAGRPRLKLTGAHAAVFVFFAIACLSVALNGHQLATFHEVAPTLKKLLLLASFVLFFLIASSVIRPREVPRLMALMVALGVIVSIATIIEAKTHYNIFYELWRKVLPVQLPPELDQRDGIGRLAVDGPTSEPLELAALLAVVFPFAVIGALDAGPRRRRWLYVVASTLILAGALASQRKTSVIAPAVGVLVLLAYRPRQMARAILISIVPLLVGVHFIAPGQLGAVFGQLIPGHASTVLTTTDRVARYDAVRPDVMTHLVLGRGFQSYDLKYRILDNEYLGLLIGVGIVGLLSYLSIFATFMTHLHSIIRGVDRDRAGPALAALAAIVIVLVSNALFDVLSFPHVSYLFFLIGAMGVSLRERSPAAPRRPMAMAPTPQHRRSRLADHSFSRRPQPPRGRVGLRGTGPP